MRRIDVLLNRLEVGQSRRQHERGLAVDQSAFAGKRLHRPRDSRKALRPVEPATAEQGDVVAGFARFDAIAVILDLVQPFLARRCVGGERGKLRRDEGVRFDLSGTLGLYVCCAAGVFF
jgi:hypothetical protein